jgi:hypothetical protein
MLWNESHRFRRLIAGGRFGAPKHLEHRALGVDLPAGLDRTGPAFAVEVLARVAELGQSVEVGSFGIRKAKDWREATNVPTHVSCARGEHRVWARESLPGNVVENISHRTHRTQEYSLG